MRVSRSPSNRKAVSGKVNNVFKGTNLEATRHHQGTPNGSVRLRNSREGKL